MRWVGRRESTNVDDRRGVSTGGMVTGGGILGIIGLIFYLFMGGDPSQMPSMPTQTQELTPEQQAADEERAKFVKVVLADTEDVWNELMRQAGRNYAEPTLTLFRGSVQSGCGGASAASGPFYCPADAHLYIDLSFYEELQNRF